MTPRHLPTVLILMGLFGTLRLPVRCGAEDPETAREAIEKQCRVFARYTDLKYVRLRQLLKRGDRAGVGGLLQTLRVETARFLQRIAWYHQHGLEDAETADSFLVRRDEIIAFSLEDYLAFIEARRFEVREMPGHLMGEPPELDEDPPED